MTLTLKSWFEVRRRFALVLLGWVFMALMLVLAAHTDHHGDANTRDDVRAIASLEIVTLMGLGSLLAGTGIITQSSNAATARMQDSVLFTLSLPVSRRGALLTRAALGALALLPLVLLFWALLPPVVESMPGSADMHLLPGALLFQFAAAAVAYSLKLMLDCVAGETTQAWLVGAVVGAGGVAMGLRWPPVVRLLNFASGANYLATGKISWLGLAVCVALSCAFVFSAVQAIERRQF